MPGQVPTKVLPEQHTVRLQDAVPGHILSRIPEMKTTTAIAAKIAVTVNFFKFDL